MSDDISPIPPKKRRYMTRWYIKKMRKQETLAKELEGRKENISDEDFRNKDDTLHDCKSKDAETLQVQSVDLHYKFNREKHRTNEFEQTDLIVRRGTPFFLTFTFQRTIEADHDLIMLQLVTGNRPQQSKSTITRLTVLAPPKIENKQFRRQLWKAKCAELKGNSITIEVTPAANVFVGVYEAYLETKNTHDPEDTPERYQIQEEIYVLFNPWCKEDIVYMEGEAEKNEYILNDTGRIWVGSSRYHHGRAWNFGQFDEPCLDAAFTLLKAADLPGRGYKNPVAIIRCLSAIINALDDDGLLEGRWTETYPKDCTVPTAWTGSVAILKEYMETKQSVRFGQCWVFSGVMTTLLRALGIPTRSVTNFESAHDTDSSMTIDFHFDAEGEPIEHLNDSVWNFHVWNESWLKRPDLPLGNDGWQAHDATPQETSGGIMRCGPAPLNAIKEGQVYLLYDLPFIFAEVNGDRVYWKKTKDNDMTVLRISKSSVGKYISTKAVGSDRREDVTHLYKYPEGSADERRVVKFVNQFSSREDEDIYDLNMTEDVDFDFDPPTKAVVGEGFELKIKVKSRSESSRKIQIVVRLMTSFYTGISRQRIKSKHETIEISPRQELEFVLPVNIEDYENQLGAEASFSTFINCQVFETQQCFMDVEKFTLEMPDLVLQCPEEIEKHSEAKMTISFTNPLALNLTNVVLHVEGARIVAPTTIRLQNAIPPKGQFVEEVTLRPTWRGHRRIIASLVSDQLKGIEGVGRTRAY